MENETDGPSLHWIWHDTSETHVRVFNDEDIAYGSFDVITKAEFDEIQKTGVYKEKEYWICPREYEDAW